MISSTVLTPGGYFFLKALHVSKTYLEQNVHLLAPEVSKHWI